MIFLAMSKEWASKIFTPSLSDLSCSLCPEVIVYISYCIPENISVLNGREGTLIALKISLKTYFSSPQSVVYTGAVLSVPGSQMFGQIT